MDLKEFSGTRMRVRNACSCDSSWWSLADLRRAMDTIGCNTFMKDYNGMPTSLVENPNAKVGKITWIKDSYQH